VPALRSFSRRFPLLSPGFWVRRKALSQGILGDSRFWQLVALLLFTRRIWRKIMGSDPITVAVERLEPGQSIILSGVTLKK